MSQPAISSTSAVQQTSSAPSRDRLVIAIDYGTIDTAVAFGLTQTDIANLDELEVVEKWPAGLSSRVPSAISYSPTADMSQQQWGFSVSEDAIVYTRTKLDLDISSKEHMLGRISDFLDGASDLRFEAVLRARGYPEHSWKDAQDMVSDYFRQVFHVVFEELAYMGGHLAQVAVDIVITTPAQQWSYKGENSLFRAVREAGFNNESFPSLGDTIIVAESDAAAIWSIRNMREQQGNESFKQGECFIFCDCGYDIVESTTYRIKCLEPTLQIEAINELKITQGGGKHIYQNFEKWLQGVIGERCFRRLDPRYDQCFRAKETWPKGMRQLAERFDQKLRCRPSDDKTFHIDLPPPLHHLSCADNVVAGELKITSKELKSFMNSWVTSIINLIEGQIQQTNEGNDRITNILLVGDYSDVLHLQNEIDLVMRSKNIKLHRPWLRWGHTATAQGAVVYGIEKSHRSDLCIAESSPRHYGLLLDDGPVVNTTPVHRAGTFTYLIQKDDLLFSDRVVTKEKSFAIKLHPEKEKVAMMNLSFRHCQIRKR
ncbi:uncharacterized protein LY89DRAFT_274643 [Mollisia scopiformis]|uniref:Uncharacterized protein n=1 Tax=Mollisia scopiformis TaxID=149040 RepID=A0A132BB67_MOLSC|nr:uncharacterized protein LY89DRAFT_274643 [Mollisia scopiformis]KUJ09631.1 hypothetical protein LY89DRAFT_274643 [Mollisia scopiformis]